VHGRKVAYLGEENERVFTRLVPPIDSSSRQARSAPAISAPASADETFHPPPEETSAASPEEAEEQVGRPGSRGEEPRRLGQEPACRGFPRRQVLGIPIFTCFLSEIGFPVSRILSRLYLT